MSNCSQVSKKAKDFTLNVFAFYNFSKFKSKVGCKTTVAVKLAALYYNLQVLNETFTAKWM